MSGVMAVAIGNVGDVEHGNAADARIAFRERHIRGGVTADRIGVETGAGNIFPHLVDEQDVEQLNGHRGRELSRFVQEPGLLRLDLRAWNELDVAGFVIGVFDQRHSEQDFCVSEGYVA